MYHKIKKERQVYLKFYYLVFVKNKKINLIYSANTISHIHDLTSVFKSAEHVLSKNGILILENLANLEKIKSWKLQLIVLPLKLKNATGSPVRAVAVLEK